MKWSAVFVLLSPFLLPRPNALAEDGYECWLRYRPVADQAQLAEYRDQFRTVVTDAAAGPLQSAADELVVGLSGLLNQPISRGRTSVDGAVVVVTASSKLIPSGIVSDSDLSNIGAEGFIIRSTMVDGNRCTVIAGESEGGALYGAFHFLRLLQLYQPMKGCNVRERPVNPLRMVDHWDNPGDDSIERGFAGRSIFHWDTLPKLDPRYRDYARLLASLGINGIVLNNVNTGKGGCQLLTTPYLPKIAALAGLFRDYGIKTYLSINYASPMRIGKLDTADPLDPGVAKWWAQKADELYRAIPDFGGFLVKADSEGQPGPDKYKRNHVQGAGVLADALKSHGGLVIWRAFVYDKNPGDRAAKAYDLFKPLDGQFADNVLVQIKNGPMDFQVREPVSPLFGAMTRTGQMIELQITQEYTGQSRHLCYLVPQWKEVLDFDTYARGKGSPVWQIVSGGLFGSPQAGMAGVINVGSDRNWTGHDLAQANTYGFGRLTWNPTLSTAQITDEWVRMTFGHDPQVVTTISKMLLDSWSIYENYTSPLGVGFVCRSSNHSEPAPDSREAFHHADRAGVGYDRTAATGSGYTSQYCEPVRKIYESLSTCPDNLLLFFHHVPYTYKLHSGETVIQHIYNSHYEGVKQAEGLRDAWMTLHGKIDEERYQHVLDRFDQQIEHAQKWRDSINSYFFQQSGIPDELGRLK